MKTPAAPKILSAAFFLALSFIGCQKVAVKDTVPKIADLSVSSNTLHTNPDANDTLRIRFYFADGDADISRASITLRDLLDTSETPYLFPFPSINTDNLNLPDGANGSVCMGLSSGELIFQQYDSTENKKVFRIFMTDNEGHKSNELQTDTITLVP